MTSRVAEPRPTASSGGDPAAATQPPGRHTVVLVVLLLAATVALRFIATSVLWLDEAQTVDIAHRSLHGLFAALRHDGSPPLYYVVLHGWTAVVGTGTFAVRALSGIFSVATLPLLWVLARRVGLDRRGAWIATMLLAANPFAVRYATEARMYSLVILLVVVAGLAYEWLWRTGRLVAGLAAAVATAALLLTHYWCLFLFAVAGAAALVAVRRGVRRAWLAVAAMVGGLVLFLPWLPSFAYQAAHTGAPWGAPPSVGTVVQTPAAWAGHGLAGTGLLLGFGYYALGVIAFAGRRADGGVLLARPRRGWPAALVAFSFLVMALGVAVSQVQHSAYASRYSAVALIPFVIAAAYGVAVLPPRARTAAVAVAGVLGLAVSATYPGQTRSEAGDVAAALAAAKPGDVVAFCPDQLGPAVHRLAPHAGRQVVYPTMGAADMVDWVDYADRNAAADPTAFARRLARLAGPGNAVWLVYEDGYPTVGDSCGAVFAELSKVRGAPTVLVHNTKHSFEKERMVRFAGR